MKKHGKTTSRSVITDVRADTAAIRFADYLLAQAKQFEGKRSGKKTKLLLLASAAKLFDRIGLGLEMAIENLRRAEDDRADILDLSAASLDGTQVVIDVSRHVGNGNGRAGR